MRGMRAAGWLVCLLAAAAGVKLPAGGEQRFVTEPGNVTVMEGGHLVLPCTVAGQVGELQWTRDDFGLGTEKELVGYSRYTMVDADLHITNISLAEDDARFQCQVGATEVTPPLRSRYAMVRVMAKPQPPVITAGPRMVVRAGRKALVQCISKGGTPASQIRWRRAGQLVSEGVEEKVEVLEDGKRMMTVSTLTFLVERDLSGMFLECEATSEAEGRTERKVGTTLEVEYEPRVELVADKAAVYEGDMVRLACRVEARPELVEYQWWVAGKEVEEARGAGEFLLEAVREESGEVVTCLARNKLGQGSADYQLDIQYAPVFVQTPRDVTGDPGQRVQLECEADSNPAASYAWTRGAAPTVTVGQGSVLSFSLSNLTAGLYTCTVTSPSSPSPVSRSARVALRGPPSILAGREVQFGAVGSGVRVACEAEATPAIETFVWTFEGSVVRSGGEYSVVETQHGPVVRSSLLVTELTEDQLGAYTCTVTNALGRASTTVTIRPVDGLPLLIMVAAAIGGLLLTLVLIVMVVTCRRLAQAPASPADKHPPLPDQVSNSSSQGTKAATLSTLSAPDDLDGSDSLPEYHANYMASSRQPDVVHSHGLEPGWHGYGHSRALYATTEPQYGAGDYASSEHNYRRFVTTPGELQEGPAYPQFTSPIHNQSPPGPPDLGQSSAAYGLSVGYAALQEDLNESSIGTHV